MLSKYKTFSSIFLIFLEFRFQVNGWFLFFSSFLYILFRTTKKLYITPVIYCVSKYSLFINSSLLPFSKHSYVILIKVYVVKNQASINYIRNVVKCYNQSLVVFINTVTIKTNETKNQLSNKLLTVIMIKRNK